MSSRADAQNTGQARSWEGWSPRLLYLTVSLGTLALISILLWLQRDQFEEGMVWVFVWIGAVAVADLFSIPVWGTVVLSLSFPLLVAAGIVFPPGVAGLVALIGSGERRELRREVSLGKALFNRSQIALATTAAASVFYAFGADASNWPSILGITALALLADLVVNLALVVTAVRMSSGRSLPEIANGMLLQRPVRRTLGYLSVGLLAPVIALLFEEVGGWGLLGVLGPVALAHELFSSQRELRDVSQEIENKTRALADAVARVAEERRQERLFVAGDLHDLILQPLYKVHLMGQVLRRDLESGRLLDLDTDLPGLLEATDVAQDAIRDMLRSLRRSSISTGGVDKAVRLLLAEVQERTGIDVTLNVDWVDGSSLSELVAYQVIREAIANVEKHSGARQVAVTLSSDSDNVCVSIDDDGQGFEPILVDREEHFGLQLMRERVEAIGGLFQIVTSIGIGTNVVARIPRQPQWWS